MATKKTANYTDKMVEALKGYSDCTTDAARDEFMENFSTVHGKSIPSIRMRLVRDGSYVKKATAKKSPTGERYTKADAPQEVETLLGFTFPDDSIEKVTMKTLKLFLTVQPATSGELDIRAEAEVEADERREEELANEENGETNEE